MLRNPALVGRAPASVSVSAIMLFQVATLLLRARIEVLLDQRDIDAAKEWSWLAALPFLAIVMAPYLRRCAVPLAASFRPGDLTLRLIVFSLLLGIVLRVGRWVALTLALAIGPAPVAHYGPPAIAFSCPGPASLVPALAIAGLLVPLVEETINRGLILNALLNRGRRVALCLSAACFALLHEPSTMPLAFVIGLFLGLQAINYGNLWAPVLAHSAYNLAPILDWTCLRIVWNPAPGDPLVERLLPPAVAAGVLVIACAAVLAGKKAAGAARPDGPGP